MSELILCRVDYVTVGGTRQSGDEDTRIRAKDSQEIWDRAVKAMPSLKVMYIQRCHQFSFIFHSSSCYVTDDLFCSVLPWQNAKIVRQWAGLRPFRNPLRLEPETMHFPSGKLEASLIITTFVIQNQMKF